MKNSVNASAFFILLCFILPLSFWLPMAVFAQEIDTHRSTLPKAIVKADALLAKGSNEAALSILEEYLNQHPDYTQAQLRKARIESQMGEFANAERTLQRALLKNPQNPDALEAMGRFYYEQSIANVEPRDRLENARRLLDQALGINPAHMPSLVTQALVRMEQKDLIGAEQLLRQALEQAPRYVPALRGMARLYMESGDWTNARYAVTQAMEIEPNDQANYFLAAQLLAKADYPSDAIQYALKSEALDYGKNLNRDYLIATQYEKLGELEKAIPYHQRVLNEKPGFAPSWQRLGDLYYSLNRPDESVKAYQKAIAIDPSWLKSLQNALDQNVRSGNLDGAIAKIDKISRIQPALAPDYQPLIANIQYAQALEKSLNMPVGQSPPSVLPIVRLPITVEQSFDDMKIALGKGVYVAGFVLPSADNGTQYLLSLPVAQENRDPIARAEALFLANEFKGARTTLESEAERFSAEEYALGGDRLFLLRDYNGARLMYQRAIDVYQIDGAPSSAPAIAGIRQAIERIDTRGKQSRQRVSVGDGAFNVKQYEQALHAYLQALQIDPQNDMAYLRMIDTLDKIKPRKIKPKDDSPVLSLEKEQLPGLKDWAYRQAVQLSPNLMDSKGFSKKYERHTEPE
ncbi:MAG: tetratricopeptide repeat protein [Vampirovibrionales bacterium]|nr:tetratricopeptide repeat protein [Vampirovibrionales bacterium]